MKGKEFSAISSNPFSTFVNIFKNMPPKRLLSFLTSNITLDGRRNNFMFILDLQFSHLAVDFMSSMAGVYF